MGMELNEGVSQPALFGPARWWPLPVVMKNWLPLVFDPASVV
jgi:hypothetical protein